MPLLVDLPAIVIDSAAQGVVILALAWTAAFWLRHGSAATRHVVWTLAFVSLCVLPVLAVVVPRYRVPIWPRLVPGESGLSSVQESIRPEPFHLEIDLARLARVPDARPAASAAKDANAVNRETAVRRQGMSVIAIVTVWAMGFLLVLTRILASLVAVGCQGQRAAPITDGTLVALLEEMTVRYGVRRRVSLRVGSDVLIPATWGFVRPVVLLPIEALDWPHDRLRAVLAHELAHVARGDFLVHTLARLACAWHWFNPLAWLAGSRLRGDCEQASDDLVLNAGLTPADYATHLVEVLRAARRGREAPLGALAMGRCRGLEDRLGAILDRDRPRQGLSPCRAALAALAATTFLLPLAFVGLGLEARAHDAPRLERLPQGVTIEVVGVSTHPSGPTTWWGPDGAPLAQPPCDPTPDVMTFADGGKQVREIVARITGLPEGATVVWHPTQCRSHGTTAPQKQGMPVAGLQRVVADFAETMATCVVHFDLASGPWTLEQKSDGHGIGIEREDRAFFFGTAHETRRGTSLAIAHNINDREVRVVAIDREGHEHLPGSSSSGGGKHLRGLDVEFSLPPSQIREYQLQSRALGRFEIKDVALQPRKAGSSATP